MTKEQLVFLYEEQANNYISQGVGVLSHLTTEVFNKYADIHREYLGPVEENNRCGSCTLNMVKRVYTYADKYKESTIQSEQISEPISQDNTINKKTKKKVDAGRTM
jgi:hypothetical protein